MNVFSVDWSQVANHYSYSSCIANLPVLGDSVAYFIERLLTRFQIDPKHVHLIGHSLGKLSQLLIVLPIDYHLHIY